MLVHPTRRQRLRRQTWVAVRILLPFTLLAGPLLSKAVRGEILGLTWGEPPEALFDTPEGAQLVTEAVEHSVSASELLTGGATSGGWVLVLAMIGLCGAWSHVHGRRRLWLPMTAAVTTIVSLGPFAAPIEGISEGWLALPFRWIQTWVPLASRLHHPERLLVLAALCLALMAGSLHQPLVSRMTPRVRACGIALILLFIAAVPALSGRQTLPIYSFDVPAYHRLLGKEGVMVHLPLGYNEEAIIYQPIHGRSLINGPGEDFEVLANGAFRRTLEDDPVLGFLWSTDKPQFDDEDLARMAERDLRYLVVHTRQMVGHAQTGGGKATDLAELSLRIDETFGPSILSSEGLRVYSLTHSLGTHRLAFP
jgi:hypothetical protein